MIDKDTVIRRAGNLLETQVDDELVALDVNRGLCFGLDAVGSRIWDLLGAGTTASKICGSLLTEYAVSADDCLRDVLELLTELEQDGLITLVDC